MSSAAAPAGSPDATGGDVGEPVVLYREDDGIAHITLNRPAKLNALNPEVFSQIGASVERFAAGEASVAILSGNGRAFAAGADIEHYVGLSVIEYADFMRRGNAVQQRFVECTKPVIAAVHGYALGGGLELALACDLIVAEADAKLGLPEAKLGLLPGGGGTQRLPRLVGAMRAAELVMTGRFISGREAVAWGLAIAPEEGERALAAARRLAELISRQAPLAVRMAKTLLRGSEAPLGGGLPFEQAVGAMLYATADAREGIGAFVEKRPARFSGR